MGELEKIEIRKFIYGNMDLIKMVERITGNEIRVRTEEGIRFIYEQKAEMGRVN